VAVIDCTVRNLSQKGAGLDVISPVGIPGEFVLTIPSDAVRFRCYVTWRKAARIGSGSFRSAPATRRARIATAGATLRKQRGIKMKRLSYLPKGRLSLSSQTAETEIFARQVRQLSFQIGRHRKFFLQNAFAKCFRLLVADGFGRGDPGWPGARSVAPESSGDPRMIVARGSLRLSLKPSLPSAYARQAMASADSPPDVMEGTVEQKC
jgi:hypothetical protein